MHSTHQSAATVLAVADWRRRVTATYAEIRWMAESNPRAAHTLWRRRRDELFAHHPASPVPAPERPAFTGLTVAPYDPAYRFEVALAPTTSTHLDVPTATDGVVPFERIGIIELGGLGSLAVWSLRTYGGGLFLPVRDALAGRPGGTFGGGRYVLDTVKGADLGRASNDERAIVVDLNFSYNPSCAYDPDWECPLAPPENTLRAPVPVGELMPGVRATD